jgi:hypothetical protein
MESIVVTAKYKGNDIEHFTHSVSYMLVISAGLPGALIGVNRLLDNGGGHYGTGPGRSYNSIVGFLTDWEEITSYPSLETVEAKRQREQNETGRISEAFRQNSDHTDN